MYKFLLALFFISSLLSAEEAITPYLTSENDTLALVEGVVNAYNGKLVQIDRDIEIQGSDPLDVTRYYDGGHHFDSEFGYGVGLSLPIKLVFYPNDKKDNVLVEQRRGSKLFFTVKKQRKKNEKKRYVGGISPEYLKSGYTNCCEALLRGEPSIYAMRIEGTKKEFTVSLGNGTKRHYHRYHTSKSKVRYYRLTLEERPNGNRRHVAYKDNSTTVSRIWTTNCDDSLILNWIDFTYEEDHVIVSASNGKKIYYQLEEVKGKAGRRGGGGTKYKKKLLSRVSGTHLLTSEYESVSRSRYISTLFSVKKVKAPSGRFLKVEYSGTERVKSLSMSGIDVPLYTFDRHSHHTKVIDALGAVQRFNFSKRRLQALIEGHRTQHYEWNKKGQLVSHTMKDPVGNKISQREYQYDDNGNITETRVIGNITQMDSNDTYVVRNVYSQDDRNLLLREIHNDKKEINFTYHPNTSLLFRKLTLADNQCVEEREFYHYDKNAILIKKIVDDGSSPDSNDLTNVTYRKITEIEPQLNPNLHGMTFPRVIREFYVDPTTGQRHLLKMCERSYTQGDHLSEEKVYDANENYRYTLSYEYNYRGQLIKEVNAHGETTVYDYDDNFNKIYEQKWGNDNQLHFYYDAANRLVQESEEHSDGLFLTTTHTYDPMGNRTSTTDHYGQATAFQYDKFSREISTTDPLGNTEFKEYDAQNHIAKRIDKDGYTTTTVYNLYVDPLEIHHPDGTSKRFAYNFQGHLVQEWKRDGTSVTYDVDYQGRPKVIKTYALNGTLLKTEQKSYKGSNLIAEIDAMGIQTTYHYDGAGRKIAKIKNNQVTNYTYDSLGRLLATKTADRVEIKAYDNLDRITEERTEDLLGNIFRKVQYFFDINGNCTNKKVYRDPHTVAETITLYNTRNQATLKIDPHGNQTTIMYHISDHLEKESIDPQGRREVEIYDPLQQRVTLHNYSPMGELLSHSSWVYDGRGNAILHHEKSLYQGQDFGIYEVSTAYDGMGQKISQTEQQQRTTSYTYQNGRLHTITMPNSVVLTHNYDPLGRLQELLSSEGTIHYRYTYDLNDNLLLAEDLVHRTATERGYDTYNRLIVERQMTGLEFHYSYDALDRLKEMTFFDGKVTYSYSPTDLLSASRYNRDNQYLYTYSQQSNWQGRTLSATLPNGITVSYIRDNLGRCAQISCPFLVQNYTYDTVNNLVATTVSDPTGFYQATYTHDDLNQLIEETGPFANQYSHDSLYNRRTKNTASYAIDGYNQLTNDTSQTYTYDNCGRRISKGSAQYTYDALGRLTSYKDGGNTITYKYDAFGRRIVRQDANTLVQYFYLGDTEIGNTTNMNFKEFRLVHKNSTLSVELEGKVYSPIRNHRGDICVLLDSPTNSVATYHYDAFGMFTHQGTIHSPWLFCGQRYDATTGLYHFAKREYDPATGRWLTPDPLGYADGPNLYAYVHNNPLIYVDPYGLWGESLKNWTTHSRNFLGSFSRGFIDDTTFGASSYMLGKPNTSTLSNQVGYYTGTGCSMAAGLFYGGTWLKGMRYGGKAAISAFRFSKTALTATKTTNNVMRARRAIKIAQETSPTVQKITRSVAKTGAVVPKGAGIFGNGLRAESSMQSALLNKHLRQLERYGKAGYKQLEHGPFRYYGSITQARTPGEMRGLRRVREWNPLTNKTKTWFETLDHAGTIRSVRPQVDGPKVHYLFDNLGDYVGTR